MFGHIPLLLRLRKGLPDDASDMYVNRHLVLEWRKTFPRAKVCPPVIYLDIWPLMDEAIAIINEVDLIQGVVQHRNPPRHAMAKYLQSFVSGNRNLSAWDGSMHKLWRSRMNPGFSQGICSHSCQNLCIRCQYLLQDLERRAAQAREEVQGSGVLFSHSCPWQST